MVVAKKVMTMSSLDHGKIVIRLETKNSQLSRTNEVLPSYSLKKNIAKVRLRTRCWRILCWCACDFRLMLKMQFGITFAQTILSRCYQSQTWQKTVRQEEGSWRIEKYSKRRDDACAFVAVFKCRIHTRYASSIGSADQYIWRGGQYGANRQEQSILFSMSQFVSEVVEIIRNIFVLRETITPWLPPCNCTQECCVRKVYFNH